MWNTEQCERLALEEQLLARYMSGFGFYDRTGNAYVQGWCTTNGGNNYALRLCLPPDFPYDEPKLWVVSPQTLWLHGNRGTVNSLGTSHAFHVYGNDSGYVNICHTSDWDASITIVKVLLKGILWCEAYDGHLRTGQDLADFLNG